MVFTSLSCLLTLTTIVSTVTSHSSHSVRKHPLLLVSFDGFRWDYLTHAELPNINWMIKQGVHATEGVKNVFDTSTLPNHWTLVTGLYPESHGIVGNFLYDPDIERKFIPKYVDSEYQNDPRYYDDGGEPIWATNQFQGGRSGSVMWWGSDNTVKYSRPTYQMAYDDKVNFTSRVDVIIEWLTNDYPINLGLLYFPEPDHVGHKGGPDSVLVTETIQEIDNVVGYLLKRLETVGLLGEINIIITSDHGMTATSNKTLIYLDDFISIEDYNITNPEVVHAQIFPHEGMLDKVYTALKEASEKPESHFKVYLKEDIPERFHIKHNERTAPISLLADLHYVFVANATRDDEFKLAGAHGYDNNEPDMHPFFVATGPSFKKGFTVQSFDSVDVYPLMCLLLGIEPAPNNGSLSVVSLFVAEEKEETTFTTFVTYLLVSVLGSGVAIVFAVAACRQQRLLKRRANKIQLSPFETRMRSSASKNSAIQAYMLADAEDEDEFESFDDHSPTNKFSSQGIM